MAHADGAVSKYVHKRVALVQEGLAERDAELEWHESKALLHCLVGLVELVDLLLELVVLGLL